MHKYDFPPAKGFFITGTDTGVGKTLVTGAIAHRLHQQGRRVGVFKPVATGCAWRREGLVSADAEFLAWAADSQQPLSLINPVSYHEPLAPLVAAERAQREIAWEEIALAYDNIRQNNDLVLVEGIGGVMVPLRRDYLVIDLMRDLALPVLIVARSKLGTLNHTFLSIEACKSRGLRVAGVVINGYNPLKASLAEEANAEVITRVSGVPVVAVIPYDTKSSVEKTRLGPDVLAAVGLQDWKRLLKG